MDKLRKKFNKLKLSEKIDFFQLLIALLAVIATVFTGSVSYFGYSINRAVEDRNRLDWNVQRANHSKSFWKDIEGVENGIIEQVDLVGGDIGGYMVASLEVFDELERLQRLGKSLKLDPENTKLQEKFVKLVSTYAKLNGSVEAIGIKYDNSVLTYNNLVDALAIKGWNSYLDQAENLAKWKSQLMLSYNKTYELIYSITKNGVFPENLESIVHDYGYEMGFAFKNLGPPSLSGIFELKKQNHPRYKIPTN